MTTARFISPFMSNGNIDEYLEAAPRPVSDNLRLKLENVLISDKIKAVLCDFGLARLADGQPSGLTTTKTIKGSTRYMSPELLEEDAVHTLHSDIWAYGCLALKAMTGSLPYGNARSDQQIVLALAQKKPPFAFSKLQDDRLKAILMKCWESDPSARPSASECLSDLPKPEQSELHSLGMKYSSSFSLNARSSGRHERGTSPAGAGSSESISDAQAGAEPAAKALLGSSNVEEGVSSGSAVPSRCVEHILPELPPNLTPSTGRETETRATPRVLDDPNLSEIAASKFKLPSDTRAARDSLKGPDGSGAEAASVSRITQPPPSEVKDQPLPVTQLGKYRETVDGERVRDFALMQNICLLILCVFRARRKMEHVA
ncbi:hypothetical protein FRC01_010781 [Tulasnella sp. 417]|nr:hypothetical protein FRC01_010781 [Tulasnella sp. 417]